MARIAWGRVTFSDQYGGGIVMSFVMTSEGLWTLRNAAEAGKTQRECSYWIPEADIVGEVPKELRGTLFRNGPGIREVYGTRLKHRK